MIIQPPATVAQSLVWSFDRNASRTTSVSLNTRRRFRRGDRWLASLTMPPLTGDDARLMRSFITLAEGVDTWVQAGDPSYRFSGPSAMTPLVNGAGQTGRSLVIDGLPNNTTIARAGDRVGVVDGVYPIAADCVSNGSGQATLTLATDLYFSPADNAAVEFYDPKALFILDAPGWSVSAPFIHGFTLNMVQDVYARVP